MAYYSKHTGTAIDDGIDINTSQNTRLTTLETNYNSLNTYAHNLLVDNSIKTSYIQNQAVTEDKLADSVKDALSSIKIYSGTLKANNWEEDLSSASTNSQYLNMWKVDKFSSRTCDGNIRSTLLTVAPSSSQWVGDGVVNSGNYNSEHFGDSYTGRATIYAYCSQNITYQTTFMTDDAGALYLNGQLVKTVASCAPTAVTMQFLKGINCIECFWTEGAGGDGWAFSPNLNTHLGQYFVALSGIPAHVQYQIITPTCLNGNNKPTSKTLFSPGMILNPTQPSQAHMRDRINSGAVIGQDDGTVVVIHDHVLPIEEDITLYWYGFET